MEPVKGFLGAGDGRNGSNRPPLAIVGSHPATREKAPYDNPRFEIWLFNEAPQKTEVYRRWDVCLQLHKPEVYTSLENWVNKGHWGWLQQDHGANKRIYMIEQDPRVPNSVRYPLEDVLELVPYPYLRSSPALALALAIYLGYREIWLYGSELTSNTEYTYQATNYAFWIGYAHGRGIDLHLECWQDEFYSQPIYGYEGEAQIEGAYLEGRMAENERAYKANEGAKSKLKNRLDQAMLEGKADKVGQMLVELQMAEIACGETWGAMSEAKRYTERTNPISRQEFERTAAQAQKDGEQLREDMQKACGKTEYVWNVWRQTGNLQALEQLRYFAKEMAKLAHESGAKMGVFRENLNYLGEYDRVVTALGGERARAQMAPDAQVGVVPT